MQQTIPYPVVLILVCGEKSILNVCHKRTNQLDSSKNAVEEQHFTDWMDMQHLETNEDQFFESLEVNNLSYTNLCNFYSGIVDRVILYKAARYVIDYVSIKDKDADKVNRVLQEIKALDERLLALRKRLKQEMNFYDKVWMNIEINKLKQQKKELIGGVR